MILKTFLLIAQFIFIAANNYFDRPLGGPFRTVFRRLNENIVRQIYQAKAVNFDKIFQKVFQVPDHHPGMYFDEAWADWRRNSLENNMKNIDQPPWTLVSVSSIKNPIYLRGIPDDYEAIFQNRDYEPKTVIKSKKYGPVEVTDDGQIRFSL